MKKRARVLALYLPQFHPIPENDLWWGKGFTEWTNVGKAQKYFRGHYQPRIPADLGYYDLRVPEVRIEQANMAREYGIEGFIYWHYWFGNGKRLLERPFNEVLMSGKPDFPFCLAWANASWQGFEYGINGRNTLIEQLYPGVEDNERHFYELLPAFKDHRYIVIDEKPVFMIFQPMQLVKQTEFIKQWDFLAKKNGLKGIYFIAQTSKIELIPQMLSMGFDAINIIRLFDCFTKGLGWIQKVRNKLTGDIKTYRYKEAQKFWIGSEEKANNIFPSIYPNWDHTPRSGRRGAVLIDSTPKLFGQHVADIFNLIKDKPMDKRIIILKSWNEWAEGNYMEPDLRYGLKYLEELKKIILC